VDVTFLALSLLALHALVPLARALATGGESPVPGPPEVQPPEPAQARLLAALRSKIPIEPVGEPPTQKDGRPNASLQCDEDRSGPVFKATAGRTRRNSGIRSSIPRRDDQIAPLVDDYVPN
jgi:hypothetical protein